MDPLSLVASISVIATLGVQISLVLFDVSSKSANANRDVEKVATEMSRLSATLEGMQYVLHEGMAKRLYKECLLSNLVSLLQRIEQLQLEIQRRTKNGPTGIRFRVKLEVFGFAQI